MAVALRYVTQIIVDPMEVAVLLVQGLLSSEDAIFGFFLPMLISNVLGGTAVL